MDMLDTDGRLGMGSPDMDQRMMDVAKMSNDMCEHKERLLYESKAASKRNDKTGSDTPVNIMAQMGGTHTEEL